MLEHAASTRPRTAKQPILISRQYHCLGTRWYLLGRLGAMTEVLSQMTVRSGGSSDTNTDFSARLGEFLDAGVYWAATERRGFAAIARYERLDVVYGGDVMNANNLGALAAADSRF